ncbi:MAG: hypothetical protein ABH859_05490 [Pseudomonadota bacterium]
MPNKKDNAQGIEALDMAFDSFIQGAGNITAALLGMINKAGGQIYALLFLSAEPLSLDCISERLSLSKSNVSINIRLLEDFNLVRKVWVKGSRKDYYAAERVYPKKVLRDFLEKIQRNLRESITIIEKTRAHATQAKVLLDDENREQAEFVLDQLNLIGLFYYAADKFFADFFSGKEMNLDIFRQAILHPDEFHPGNKS